MKIEYGIFNNTIDVTNICKSQLLDNNIITIPSGDHNRSKYFTDPLPGVLKSVFVSYDNITRMYSNIYIIYIDITNNKITTNITNNKIKTNITNNKIKTDNKLYNIHSKLKLNYGSFYEELPEQKMAVRYLTGNENVLEIGGNIGRNSLVIASIVNNLVTLESDPNIANQLRENRDVNNLKFHIENSALSKRKLIQKGWDTIQSDVLQDGYNWVSIISLEELNRKYNIKFDTLVLDCEGAFYYILMDMPEILDNIKLIIMENDYHNMEHKVYIDNILKKQFYVEYSESGGWGPCFNNFYEVWKRI